MPQASQQIFGQLSKAVRLKRAIWLGRSVAAVTAYGAAIAACHFALDWSWRPGPTPRLLLLAALLAAVGYVLWREVWLPLRQLPTHDDLALEIERYYPLLRGRFISSVQLGRRLGQPGVTVIDCGALSLIRSLIEETVGVISALNLRAVPDRRAVKRAAAVAAAALLAWVVFVTATPTGRMCFPVWLNRLFDPLSAAAYPAKTIVILEKGSEYRIVARGEDVELKAHAAGIIPASGSIWIQRSGQRWVEQPVVGSGRRFAFVHKAVVESFDYYWQMGDGRSPKCHVEVVIPPQARAVRARYEFPAYTRRLPEMSSGGNLEALPGTQAALSIVTNKPIARGALLFENGREVTLDTQLGTTCTAAVEITAERTSYRVHLVDEHGFKNNDPMEYAVQPQPDEMPRVELRNMEERKFVTRYAVLPVEIFVRDDYGVTAANLHLNIAGAREETVDVPLHPNQPEQTITHTLRLEQWDLKPGAEATLWASAVDNRAVGGPQTGYSAKVLLEVVTPADLLRLMRERMESLFPRLERTGYDALESKTAVEDMLKGEERGTVRP